MNPTIQELLKQAADAYYRGEPFMSDEEFDRLAEAAEFEQVGESALQEHRHQYPMYSLKKYYNQSDIPNEFHQEDIVITDKLDGAAISLLYIKGTLVRALTRGNGITGRDITEKAKLFVPDVINTTQPLIQITGEAVVDKSIPNARNYVSGALNLKNLEEFKTRLPIYFIAYGVQGFKTDLYSKDMFWLGASLGFDTVVDYVSVHGPEKFPLDGAVFRINSNSRFEELGYTSHSPRGACALKENKKGEITTLIDVIWQVGKSGVVSPVAILEPVDISGAVVTRATLHNIDYINALGLYIGCKVEVIRSGEIIPRIVGLVEPTS